MLNSERATSAQKEDFPDAVDEAQRYVNTSVIPIDMDHWEWKITWDPEYRVGRGQALDAIWCDGEYLVHIRMDVYGYPSVSVAETRWIHNSSLEECSCDYCEAEREEYE